MKKIFTLTLALMITAIVGSSCRRTVVPGERYEPTEITFTASINNPIAVEQFEAGDQISVMATNAAGENYANVTYEYAGSIFSSSTPYTYASEEDKLEFRAVYPFAQVSLENGDFSFEVAKDQNEGANYAESDLMTSYVAATNAPTPNLEFDHLLSNVIVNIVSSDVDLDDAVATLNAKVAADCNIKTGAVTASGDDATINMAKKSEQAFAAIVVPQIIAANTALATVTVGGEPYELVLDEETVFEPTKQYEYKITLKGGEVTFVELINDWTDDYLFKVDEITDVVIVENEYESLLVDVNVSSNFTDAYALFYMSAEDYEVYDGDVEAYAVDFIAEDIETYGTDYTSADGIYVFEGDLNNFNFLDSWNLTPGVEFYLVAVGADADGELTTNTVLSESFVVKNFINPEDVVFPDAEFGGFEVKEITSMSVTFDVFPNDETMPYVFFAMPKSYYDSYASDEALFVDDMVYLTSFFENYYGITLQEGLPQITYAGDALDNVTDGLDPETEYVIYAYGVDAEAVQPLSKVAEFEFTTEAEVLPTGSLASITVTEVFDVDATVEVDAGDFTGNYYFYNIATDDLNTYYGGDAEIAIYDMIQYDMENYGTDMSVVDDWYVFNGDAIITVSNSWNLDDETDYTVIVAGVTASGDVCSNVVSDTYSTKGTPADAPAKAMSSSNIGERHYFDFASVSAKPKFGKIVSRRSVVAPYATAAKVVKIR